MWKEIVKGILTVAFAIGASESGEGQCEYSDSEFFHLVNIKLTQLRAFGERSRQPFTTTLPSQPIGLQDTCPLNQSYCLYLTSTALRNNVSHSGELNTGAQSSIVGALRVALEACEKIKPVGLAVVLSGVLKMEILVVEFGTTLANARMSLDACLVKQENQELLQDGIESEMRESLELVKSASSLLCSVLDINGVEVRQILELSKIVNTLKKYQSLGLDLDEYDVGVLAVLVEKLSAETEK